jgi:hypothetical protein
MKRFIFLLPICLVVTACGTNSVKTEEAGASARHAQWETKAVIRDLKNNKSHSLDIDVLTDYTGRLRMEISALMGVQVASLVLNQEDIRYAVYSQKRFFQGKPSESSFLPLINIPIHPRNFLNLITDAPLKGPSWECVRGADSQLTECNQTARKIKVQWQDRTPEGQKKVLITGPGFEMRWLFRPPQTEVQFKNDTFQLEIPSEFKTVQLK